MSIFMVLVIGLAVWRISSLLVNEEGPYRVFFRFRLYFGAELPDGEDGVLSPRNEIGKALLCIWCTSIWVSLPFAIRFGFPEPFFVVIYWAAFSAVAIIVQQVVDRLSAED